MFRILTEKIDKMEDRFEQKFEKLETEVRKATQSPEQAQKWLCAQQQQISSVFDSIFHARKRSVANNIRYYSGV